jgi:hypothetical protein
MFLGLPDPDPLVRGMDPDLDPALDPDPDHHAKTVRKTLIPSIFLTLFDYCSLKNDVNVASKRNKQKKLC